MSGAWYYTTATDPLTLATTHYVNEWLRANLKRAHAEPVDGDARCRVTRDGVSVVFDLPLNVGTLRWAFQGED